MPRKGETMAYRSMPSDFAQVYVRLGINGAMAHYRAHHRSVSRWIDEAGGEDLRMLRREHLLFNGRQPSLLKVWHRKRLMELTHVSDLVD